MQTWVFFLLFSPVYVPLVISITAYINAAKKNYAKKALSLVLINLAFLFWGLYFFFIHNYAFYAQILIFNVMSLLLLYPSIYIYVKLLTQPSYSFRKIIIHLIPALITLLQGIIYYFILDSERRELFVKDFRYHPKMDDIGLFIFFICRIFNLVVLFWQIFYYGLKTHATLRKHNARILNVFSNTEGIQLNGIKTLNYALLISSLASIGFYSINPVKVFGNYVVLIIPLAIISVSIWLLGIVGLRQKMIPFTEEKRQIDTKPETNANSQSLYESLLRYFDRNKPYLNPELKIDDLILPLGTNRTHLSNAINQFYGKNFNRFVNDYRIEYAKSFITKSALPNASKEDIAVESGFGSVRSFERNFKEILGVSYQQYMLCL